MPWEKRNGAAGAASTALDPLAGLGGFATPALVGSSGTSELPAAPGALAPAAEASGSTTLAASADADNHDPTVLDVRLAALAGGTTSVDAGRGLLRFASDPDGDSLSVQLAGVEQAALAQGTVAVSTELGGSLSVAADGSFRYQPPPGVVAELDRAPFRITDGRGGGAAAELVLSITPGTLAGHPGFEIGGSTADVLVGSSVTGVGDFNGDGLDDVLVTARSGGRDVGHLLLGSRAPGNVALNAGDSVRILAETAGLDSLGVSVSPAGFVNDDRLADFILGVHQEPLGDEPEQALGGKAYVIFGSQSPPAQINLATLAEDQRGFVIQGAAGQDHLGFSVAGAGNVDGSGGDDLLLGASGASPTEDAPAAGDGKAYVVFGKSGFGTVNLANLGSGGYRLDGEPGEGGQAGTAVTGLGDWNGDGLADLAVSAPQLNGAAGRIYVAFGRAGGGVVQLGDVALGLGGFAIDGPSANDQAGRTLHGGGDLGGSELPDLIIGVPNPSGANSSGSTIVVYGKTGSARVALSQLDGGSSLGFVVRAESAADRSGFAVAGPGDFNGDGASDLLIGAADQGQDGEGAAYLLYGSRALQAGIDRLASPTELGITLRGESAGARLGFAAAAAGDVNGDGYPDVILGAPQHESFEGRAYVLLGHP